MLPPDFNTNELTGRPASKKASARWYDKRPQVKQSVEVLTTFPDEILTIIAEGINVIVEREYKASELLKSFKSLGTEKILGLYKSKNKMRKMDQNPTLHKTINYMFVISEENQVAVAKQVLELVTVIHDYLKTCKETSQPATMNHVSKLRNSYVDKGLVDAKKLLKSIREEFIKTIENTTEYVPRPTQITDSSGGMKINKDIHTKKKD